MITLEPLEQLLVDSKPIENEITEIRFGEVVTCIEQEKISEAMRLIAAIIGEGNLDIRVIVYYFYGYFPSNSSIRNFVLGGACSSG